MKSREALKQQKAHGDSLREWLQDRAEAARKASKIDAENRRNLERGTDRVPERFKVRIPEPEYLVEHFDDNHESRRKSSVVTRDERGHAQRRVRGGTNQTYYNPDRTRRR